MIQLISVLFLVTLATASIPATPKSSVASPKTLTSDYILPYLIKPIEYTIEIEPDFDQATFNGSVAITFEAVQKTNTIVLHGRELQIRNDSEYIVLNYGLDPKGRKLVAYYESNDDKNELVFKFDGSFEVGEKATLEIKDYKGSLLGPNAGFYLVEYVDPEGKTKKFGVTQFESTDARRAFPCLDEPDYKASYTLYIYRPQGYMSLSNVPATKNSGVEVTPGRFQDEYVFTKKMSTYLLAFLVAEFSSTDYLGIHRVYARPELIEAGLGEYALYAGYRALRAEEKFLNVNFTLEKMDQIAIPNDYYAAGAMENWGLVTYRESQMLFDKVRGTTSQKQAIATTITHEFGHQWFGDLVSPKWWRYIWLNEGFATYFEWISGAEVEPEWELLEQFPLKNVQAAFGVDATLATRMMNADAGSPDDISALFDTIAYQKSGAVIRMAETFLTTEVFRNGLNYYLNEKQFDTAEPSDLYSAWQWAVDQSGSTILPNGATVADIMTTWDSQEGYPVVDVVVNREKKQIELSQSRFLLKNENYNGEEVWFIPITVAVQNLSDFSDHTIDTWLTEASGTYDVNKLEEDYFIILNKQQRGYYRVNYDEPNWRLLISYLLSDDFANIDINNRAQLLDDSFNLARAGLLNYTIPLDLSKYLIKETSYIPFYSFLNNLEFLNQRLASSERYDNFKAYVLNVLSGVHEYLGAEEKVHDKHTDKLNRGNVLRWMCRMGHEHCRMLAVDAVKKWMEVEEELPEPDVQSAFFCGAAADGDREVWDFLYEKYVGNKDQDLQSRILSGLGCSEDQNTLHDYIQKIFDEDSGLEEKHRSAVLSSVYSSGRTQIVALLGFITERYEEFAKIFNVVNTLKTISNNLASEADLNLVETIVKDNNLDESILDGLKENIEWSANNLDDVNNWLGEESIAEPEPEPDSATTILSTSMLIFGALLLQKLFA